MRGPKTLPGNPLRGVIAAESPHRAAQAALADCFAAVVTVARITGTQLRKLG